MPIKIASPFAFLWVVAVGALPLTPFGARADAALDEALDQDYAHLESLYIELHRNPEPHDQERVTGARMAAEMESAGFEVTTEIGGHGVIGILENGEGPVLPRSQAVF